MNRRTYITKNELKIILDYCKQKELYRHYVILLCLTELSIKYKDLEDLTWDKAYILFAHKQNIVNELKMCRRKMEMKHKYINGHSRNKVVQMTIRGFNKVMKLHQTHIGLRDIVDFSTKLFNTKIIVESEEVYGYVEYIKASKIVKEKRDNFIYVLRHNHRDERIVSLFTDNKIGITNNPYNRKSSLTLGPVGIECIKLWKVEISFIGKIEKLLHTKFSERRIIGEWFEDENNTIIADIEREIMTLRLLEIDIKEINPTIMS
jgi:hypothetical protein